MTYIEIAGEVYSIQTPILSAHNLIIGQPYLDIGDQAIVRKLNAELRFVITFTRRGWFSDSDDFKCVGELFENDNK